MIRMTMMCVIGGCAAVALALPQDSGRSQVRDDRSATVESFVSSVAEASPDRLISDSAHQPMSTGAFIDAGRGPITVHVPVGYDPEVPTPMIILLHGYMTTGPEIDAYLQFSSLVDELGFLYLNPQGTSDFLGNPFWNATDACCDLFGSGPDDSSYLREVIELMQATYNVDPRRIHFAGHSNGGFMSYRMACDHADLVASLVSLAGSTHLDASDCNPSEPVATLQIHGTSDTVIQYGGGCIIGDCYPGAVTTAEYWAAYNDCDVVGNQLDEMLDLVASLPGEETTVVEYEQNCAPGGSAELWTVANGPHSPVVNETFRRLMVEFLLTHPKPSPCPGDLDGSGAIDVSDLLMLLSEWGDCEVCASDITGDGVVDVADLLAMLAGWGDC